jgi:hypothetical protein
VLDGVRMVRTDLLEEPLGVVYRRSCLELVAVCGSCSVPHVEPACFLTIVALVASRGHSPLRTLLAPLLATFDALLGVMGGNVGQDLLAATWGHLPAVWGQTKFNRLIAGGVVGGDVAKLLSGVPKSVVRCLEGRRLLRIVHAASGHLRPKLLGVRVVSLLVIVFSLVRVPRASFGLHAYVPLVSMLMSLGFDTLTLLPPQSLG